MAGYFTDTALVLEDSDSIITATRDLTDVLDCQATPTLRDLGIRPMFVEVTVAQAFDNCTSITLDIRSDSTTNLDTSQTDHASKTIPLASLTLGARFILALPTSQTYERYLGGEVTVTGTAPTVGKLHVAIVPAVKSYQDFADGSDIT